MNCSLLKKRILNPWIGALTLLSLTISQAETATVTLRNEEAEQKTIHWPTAPQTKISARNGTVDFDGAQVKMLNLQFDSFEIELALSKGLSFRANPSAQYAASLSGERIPGVTLGIATFAPEDFLSDLSDSNWDAYKLGLTKDNPHLKIVRDDSNIGTRSSLYTFGKDFRQLAFELGSSGNEFKRREVFFMINGKLVAFTVEGMKEAVDQSWIRIDHLIGEMTLVR
ncbi:hypothetical protein [Pelagicoccus albus]|uniref:Uncharacterized protein n=1 Tax=Pelagicoccus albus TaxID=415222 RepID=A0A7X1B2W9_9BACT|nr:hypothetical protein [Pelagicoccus albus]MBC2604660.1 hypothetical protein [Pelagicoccus albus]